jgi:hypothetical protein
MGYVNKTYLSTQFKNFADKIAKVFSKIGHTHTKADITNFPTSMPANGGNADTVGGHTVGVNVPSNAKFTDTWRPVVDNLTSTATDSSLSANQGKVLNDKISELSNYYQKKSYVHTVDKDSSSTLVIPFPYADAAIITIYLNGVHLIEGVDYNIMSTGNIIFQHALKKDTKIEFDVFQSVTITNEDWTKFQPPIDNALSATSTNPVQNKVLTNLLSNIKLDNISLDSEYVDHLVDNNSYISNKTVYLKLQIQLKKGIPANTVVTISLTGCPSTQTWGVGILAAAAYSIPIYIAGNNIFILNNSEKVWGASGWTPNIIGSYLSF